MGDLNSPPVLPSWARALRCCCNRDFARLVAKGLRVIRYDNADTRLATVVQRRHCPEQPLATRLVWSWLGLPSQAASRWCHMAADAAALLSTTTPAISEAASKN